MAISIDWPSKVIFVPKADLGVVQLAPTEIRELDLNVFRLALKNLEDDALGMPWLDTHRHVAPVNVGGVTLARVVEIINGYTVTFEDGQYAVNLFGANSNVGDVTNVNQVSVRSANSAGLVQSREIEQISFNNGVSIDIDNGVAGTAFPVGTPGLPVNNWTDAFLIAQSRSLRHFYILSSSTPLPAGNYDGFNFSGPSADAELVCDPGAVTNGCHFNDLYLTGSLLSSEIHLRGCVCYDLSFGGERIEYCNFSGNNTLASAELTMVSCVDVQGGVSFDIGGMSGPLIIREFLGDIIFTNKANASLVSVDIRGTVTLSVTVTNGQFVVYGIGGLLNNSSGTTVVSSNLVTNASIADSVLSDARSLTVGKYLAIQDEW